MSVRATWATVVAICYFVLTAMAALAVFLFLSLGTVLGAFLATLVAVIGARLTLP